MKVEIKRGIDKTGHVYCEFAIGSYTSKYNFFTLSDYKSLDIRITQVCRVAEGTTKLVASDISAVFNWDLHLNLSSLSAEDIRSGLTRRYTDIQAWLRTGANQVYQPPQAETITFTL